MKRTCWVISLVFVAVLVLGGTAFGQGGTTYPRYPIMRPDSETLTKWMQELEAAPKAKIDAGMLRMLSLLQEYNAATSMDLLNEIDYDPLDRNQGWCGNCWVWAGTGVMEIAHRVENNVFDRLSIQLFDSCWPLGWVCCGGNLGEFASWYSSLGYAIPWDNTNADFDDMWLRCPDGGSGVPCASIATTPRYPINAISEVVITTRDIPQADAINNIKAILNQNRGVYFSFALPDGFAWDDFFDFWDGVGGETEASLCTIIDDYGGREWDDVGDTAGAHAVVILGYNDDDADPANHYWLALNSWGTPVSGGRPNGLFRVPMQMNYSLLYPDTNNSRNIIAFGFRTLDIEFGNALPRSDPNGPYVAECEGVVTSVQLDGSGSFDPEGGALTYAWTTNCPGGTFDNPAAQSPVLYVDTAPGCSVVCSVSLVVTDPEVASSDPAPASVTIRDTLPPLLTVPPDVTIECDQSTAPSNTGLATATDNCDPAVDISYVDVVTPGACPEAKTITRTWTGTDNCGHSSSGDQIITVVDTTPPVLTAPGDVTVECDESTLPSNTGMATATDNCDAAVTITYSDAVTPGDCPQEETITRTWTGTDDCGNSSSAEQIITVVDTTPPVISCNSPTTITPPDAPVSFTASAADNCDEDPYVEIVDYFCYKMTKKAKLVDKRESCVVEVNGDTITILDSGGVGTFITWTVRATDGCGNVSTSPCEVEVINPAQ